MLLSSLLALLIRPAVAADPPYSREELDALEQIREADLGVERVYADDGTSYYLQLPAGLETPAALSCLGSA